MKAKISVFLIIIIFLNISTAFALDISAKSGVVLNAETDELCFSKNPDVRYPLASMTKVMAVYVIMDTIRNGELELTTKIPVSKYIHNYSRDPSNSNVILNAGSYYTVDELLDSIFVVSSCSSVLAIADYISGSEAGFVKLMNQTASDLGLNAFFENSTGTTSSNVISARSMAVLAASLVTEFSEVLERTKKRSISFRGAYYSTTNQLLGSYNGVDGLKTGTSSAAGACFTATASRDGVRLVSVVMGEPSTALRFSDTRKMLDLGFSYSWRQLSMLRGEGEAVEIIEETEAIELQKEVSVIVNGANLPFIDIAPVNIDGNIFVPIRIISSALYADINWQEDGSVDIISQNRIIKLNIGSDIILKNGAEIQLNAPPFIKDGYTLVPLRAIAECFDAIVEWNQEQQQAIIAK